MKRVIMIAALLMVGCGGNKSQNKTTADVEKNPVKVSEMIKSKDLPELKAISPDSLPIDIQVVTADKNAEYIKNTKLPVRNRE